MRVSIVSILLTGGVLALGACGTSGDSADLTRAELAEVCRGVARAEAVPTGRQTGDVRHDYVCRSVHADDRRDRNVGTARGARSAAIDRQARGGN